MCQTYVLNGIAETINAGVLQNKLIRMLLLYNTDTNINARKDAYRY